MFRNEETGEVNLDLVVPVILPGKEPAGVVVLRIDPTRYLFPLIQSWPTASPSAETLLARRDGDDVVFMNPPRHRKALPFSIRFPVNAPNLAAAAAVRGHEGIFEGEDYRGVAVLAVLKRIPGTRWHLITKVNADEVYAPIRSLALRLGGTMVVLLGALAAASVMLWRSRKAQILRERYAYALRYEYVTRFANDPFLLFDAGATVVEANERAVAAYGYIRDELIGMHISQIRAPETVAEVEAQWKQAGREEGVIFETLHRHKDGMVFPVEVSSRAFDIDGVRYVQSFIRDISERKEAERRLRAAQEQIAEREAQLRHALYVARLGPWEVDLRTGVFTWSKELSDVLGLRPGDAASPKAMLELVHPEDREAASARFSEGVRSGEAFTFRHRMELPDGTRVIAGRAQVLRDAEGRPEKLAGIAQDITETARAEEALREASKRESIGLLAGGIAHDFNNLLTGIVGGASLLQNDGLPPDQARCVDMIVRSGERAAALTRQLLAYAGKGQFIVEEIDLTEAARDIEGLFEFSIPRLIHLELPPPGAAVAVRADASQIQQIVMNLVINAVEAIGEQPGTISVRTSTTRLTAPLVDALGHTVAPGNYAVLEVVDTGCGMDERTRKSIFDPFFTTKTFGRGLGLAAVSGIVRSSAGGLIVESKPGEGTTFRVLLPSFVKAATA
jgi:PAS domain S-box-containing protein